VPGLAGQVTSAILLHHDYNAQDSTTDDMVRDCLCVVAGSVSISITVVKIRQNGIRVALLPVSISACLTMNWKITFEELHDIFSHVQ
jgi:hypothetical protein